MFRLVDTPYQRPGVTLIGSTRGPVVEGPILVNGGRVYISETEAAEIVRHFPAAVAQRAEAIGWVPPHELAEAQAEIARLQAELAQARAEQTRVVSVDEVLPLIATGNLTPPAPEPLRAA